MPIRIKVDDRKIRKALKALSPKQTKQILQRGANRILRDMRLRIEKGIGSSGEKMPLYSPSYAEIRKEAKRPVDRRNLTFHGNMLGKVNVGRTGSAKSKGGGRRILKATPDRVLIGWPPGPQADKALANERRTPFVEPTAKEAKTLREFLGKLILSSVRSK